MNETNEGHDINIFAPACVSVSHLLQNSEPIDRFSPNLEQKLYCIKSHKFVYTATQGFLDLLASCIPFANNPLPTSVYPVHCSQFKLETLVDKANSSPPPPLPSRSSQRYKSVQSSCTQKNQNRKTVVLWMKQSQVLRLSVVASKIQKWTDRLVHIAKLKIAF
jgi:hypothetical protein